MKFLGSLKIRTRLLMAVLVPVLITAATIASITITQIQENGEEELQRLEDSLVESRMAGLKNLVAAAKAVVLQAKNDPSLTEEEAKEEAAARLRSITYEDNNYIYSYSRDYNNNAYAPDPSKEGPTSNTAVRELVYNLFQAAEQGDGTHRYEYINPASGEMEPKLSYTTTIPDWDWMMGAGVYITDIREELAATRQELDESMTATVSYTLIDMTVVVAIALLIGVLVGRTVTRPLNGVSDMMQEIADGDGDLRKRLPDKGNDELAELGRRFNAFVSRIQATISEVGATTDRLASAAGELSRVAEETLTSVQEQGSETDQIASAINQMAATIQQVSGNASEVEGAASDADRMARDGGETINSAQGSVNSLSEEIQATAQSIDALAEKSGDIQQVLDVIHSVTEQTNLLALNAAIEAARAGEHGRGFSVVADEVRQLAKRSAESADQIRVMIDGFVSESRSAVNRMSDSRKKSDETVERINHATDALGTIGKSVGQIHDQVAQIATASEQQSQVAEEINQNVVRIVEAARRSDTGVTRTSESSQELTALGDNLRQLVGQFKV